jgi:hypothetical protein
MELSIWSPDFVAVHKWFFGIYAAGTISFVLGARSFEPYRLGHLLEKNRHEKNRGQRIGKE